MSELDLGALLTEGARALADSRLVRARSRGLHDETLALVLTYRLHLFQPQLRGGADADDWQHRDEVLRDFAFHPAVKTFGGPSRGGTCAVCGSFIMPKEIEYDIEAGAASITVDRDCFRHFVEARVARV